MLLHCITCFVVDVNDKISLSNFEELCSWCSVAQTLSLGAGLQPESELADDCSKVTILASDILVVDCHLGDDVPGIVYGMAIVRQSFALTNAVTTGLREAVDGGELDISPAACGKLRGSGRIARAALIWHENASWHDRGRG